jgi:hypothetical protein
MKRPGGTRGEADAYFSVGHLGMKYLPRKDK